jgi:prolyl-tRNA synthetase
VQVAPPAALPLDGLPAAEVVDTPDTPTIQTLVDLFNARADLRRDDRDWTAADTLKNLVVKLKYPDGTITPLAIGVPGDREVDMKRFEAQVEPAEIEPFSEADFAANPHLAKGYIGPGAWARASPRASASWSTRASSRALAGSPAPTRPVAT